MLLRMVWAAVCLGKLFLGERREEGIDEPQMTDEKKAEDSLSTGDRGESNSREILVLCKGEAVLDGLLQVGNCICAVPLWAVHMDHLFAGELVTRTADSRCGRGAKGT